MEDSWCYWLAFFAIILLLIAGAILAYDDHQRDNSRRLRDRDDSARLQFPLDFGALGL